MGPIRTQRHEKRRLSFSLSLAAVGPSSPTDQMANVPLMMMMMVKLSVDMKTWPCILSSRWQPTMGEVLQVSKDQYQVVKDECHTDIITSISTTSKVLLLLTSVSRQSRAVLMWHSICIFRAAAWDGGRGICKHLVIHYLQTLHRWQSWMKARCLQKTMLDVLVSELECNWTVFNTVQWSLVTVYTVNRVRR